MPNIYYFYILYMKSDDISDELRLIVYYLCSIYETQFWEKLCCGDCAIERPGHLSRTITLFKCLVKYKYH